ncbi:MAG: nicotinamide-nucleotide adenylyltransferase [Thermoplasmata archaeon]|nr:nicotinamide-nucleotide adenylyltransferase [Thermoplasmata archaeon]
MRGLFIGRFQPLHLGHVKVVNFVLNRCDELILGIGSAQYSHTPENPFSAGERFEMLMAVFRDKMEATKIFIVPIPDVHNHNLWVPHVESLVPGFDVVFASNPLTELLFSRRGYRVEPVPVYDRATFSSSEVRRRMVTGENWEELVPEEVVEQIKKIEGVRRVKALCEWHAGDRRSK